MRIHEDYVQGYGIYFDNERCVYKTESQFQTIEIYDNQYFGKILVLDGVIQLTERDHFTYHEMITVVPYLLHKGIESVLIIGGGDCGTLAELAKLNILDLTLVDIDEKVYESISTYLPELKTGINFNNVNMLTACGADFIKNTDKKFDLVIIDSTDPTESNQLSSPLFDRKFYQNIRAQLNEGGILVAQGGMCELNDTVARRFQEASLTFDNKITYYHTCVPSYGGKMLFAMLFNDSDKYSHTLSKPKLITKFNNLSNQYQYINTETLFSSFCHPQITINTFGDSYQQLHFV